MRPESDYRLRARARLKLLDFEEQRDLGFFIERHTPGFRRPDHLTPVLDVFERIQRGEQVFALVSAPPRHHKSQTVFHGAARLLKYRPSKRVVYATYNEDFAAEQSRLARTIAERAGVWIRDELEEGASRWQISASVKNWQTGDGGGFKAVGAGGGILGSGADVLLIDDPYKDAGEAESPSVSEQRFKWFQSTAFNRLEPGASCLVMHQRWSDNDMLARLRKQAETDPNAPPWESIELPAIQGDGQPLCPWMYDLRALARIRATVGEHYWWAQYMQRPRPRGSRFFYEPVRFEPPLDLKGMRLGISCDPAATKDTRNDAAAIGVGAFQGWGDEMKLHMLRVWQLHLEVPGLAGFLHRLQQRIPGAPIIIEAVAGFKAVPQLLRRLSPKLAIHEAHPEKDKFLRAQPCAARWNHGRILVPTTDMVSQPLFDDMPNEDGGRWLDTYLEEVRRFTGAEGGVDDQTDMTVHLWDWGERAFEGERKGDASGSRRGMADTGGF